MTSWNDARSEAKTSASGTGIFLKLREDGERVELALVGEPHPYWRPAFEGRKKKTLRFLLNVFVPVAGMKVFEANAATFEALASVREEIDPTRQLVRLKRNGKPRDPKTSYLAIPAGVIPPEVVALIAKAEPFDLADIATKSIERAGGAA